ncbi:large ribosomal subunit protein mL62-like [Ruditapes philippinarum]|uniref:large ribosomal subunit protein mL62-like n=1 Tax=Ruditapes philippinarum TaxID=129788 RepID=UPI00295C349F|nr:large ribosomal subunit protein mL62-like [Ruditapes philippinarum]
MFACACRAILRAHSLIENNNQRFLSSVYTSKISLTNLYSKKQEEGPVKLKVDNIQVIDEDTDVEKFSGVIPLDKIQIQYSRSSGPGGQNVNKVNSKVFVRFNVDDADWIPDWVKPKIKEQQANKITKNGDFIVTSEKTRKQILNQADCLDKIRHMIFQASILPKELTPEQKAVIEKRERAANEKRIQEKKRRSLLKRSRSMSVLE